MNEMNYLVCHCGIQHIDTGEPDRVCPECGSELLTPEEYEEEYGEGN